MPFAIAAHVLAAIVWIGGMFFAYVCLRPSLAGILEPPQPARLWRAALGRFFRWVWAAIVLLLGSGLYMAFTRYGAMGAWPVWLHVMFGIGQPTHAFDFEIEQIFESVYCTYLYNLDQNCHVDSI